MSASLNALIPELQPFARDLVNAAGQAGLMPRITSTLRSRAEQERLWRRYQQGLAPFPVAPPGTSSHEYGEAFDLVVSPFEALADVGAFWRSMGGTWGGQRDPVHFELPGSSQAHRGASGAFAAPSPYTHALGVAVDIIIGLNPFIGALELAATLVALGYPESQVLKFLSGPAEYLTQ